MSFQLLRLKNYPIYEQLLLEERLLRSHNGNWCLINQGTTPAIVMGISGKKEELVDIPRAHAQNIPVIKRFSGGGTVVVDENTLFITFICQKDSHNFAAYPEPIMQWTEQIYRGALQNSEFRLKQNDYVIADRKFGGNAQYIKKDRWLHHTSILWDFDPNKMECLLHPKKTPVYRQGRSHLDFICRLSKYFPNQEQLIERIIAELQKQFSVQNITLPMALSSLPDPVRQSTHYEK